jgi:hypothetical protein
MSDLPSSMRRRAPGAASRRHPRSARSRLVLPVAAAACLLAVAAPAAAASPPISNPRIMAHLDFSRGQTPENLALEPGGAADVTFAEAAQVARVSPDSQVRILAQLPKPAGGAGCPVLGALLRAPALSPSTAASARSACTWASARASARSRARSSGDTSASGPWVASITARACCCCCSAAR